MSSIQATIIKANAHYICQECGSTELIQAHHQIPGNDNSLIALCAECHSKKHPNVPKALFFSAENQPYWHNKSASSIAKKLGVCSRTVIRKARRLGILRGRLSDLDYQSLLQANSHQPKTASKTRFHRTHLPRLKIIPKSSSHILVNIGKGNTKAEVPIKVLSEAAIERDITQEGLLGGYFPVWNNDYSGLDFIPRKQRLQVKFKAMRTSSEGEKPKEMAAGSPREG